MKCKHLKETPDNLTEEYIEFWKVIGWCAKIKYYVSALRCKSCTINKPMKKQRTLTEVTIMKDDSDIKYIHTLLNELRERIEILENKILNPK